MEERRAPLPPPPSSMTYHTVKLSSTNETYVVQMPRDHIYRIPPPDHARIIEEHYRIASDPSRTHHRRLFLWITASLLLLFLLIITIVSILRHKVYSPRPPEFSVVGIQVKNLDQYLKHGRPLPVYTLALRARNPNSRMEVSYKGGREASLSFKEHKIGGGKVPLRVKGSNAVVDFQVLVTGKPPPGMSKSLTGSTDKRMELKAEVPVEIKSWIRSENLSLKIYCDFTVKNSLEGKTKPMITSQKCKTVS